MSSFAVTFVDNNNNNIRHSHSKMPTSTHDDGANTTTTNVSAANRSNSNRPHHHHQLSSSSMKRKRSWLLMIKKKLVESGMDLLDEKMAKTETSQLTRTTAITATTMLTTVSSWANAAITPCERCLKCRRRRRQHIATTTTGSCQNHETTSCQNNENNSQSNCETNNFNDNDNDTTNNCNRRPCSSCQSSHNFRLLPPPSSSSSSSPHNETSSTNSICNCHQLSTSPSISSSSTSTSSSSSTIVVSCGGGAAAATNAFNSTKTIGGDRNRNRCCHRFPISSSIGVLWSNISSALMTMQCLLLIALQTKFLLHRRQRRRQMQHQQYQQQNQQNTNPISTRLKERNISSSNYSPLFTIIPVICSFLITWFLLLSSLPSAGAVTNTAVAVAASDDVKLRSNETVCKSIDIRNSPSEFRRISNCTVIEGFLLITLIDKVNHSDFKLTFPQLTEVTEYVLIYRVNGLRTLSDIFPNLTVIRGKSLFEGFALVIYQNTHLEEVGLKSLRTIAKGAVRIEKNPVLCFVHTIDWTQIAIGSDMDFFAENKPINECPQCPGSTELSRLDDLAGERGVAGAGPGAGHANELNCPLFKGQRHCWNSRYCQKICPATCKDNCDDDSKCCNPACLGGCATDNPNSCTVCRALVTLGTCMNECPKQFFTYLGRSCVTEETCLNRLKTKFEIVGAETLVPFNGVCSTRCPEGYFKTDFGCEKCKGRCVKTCEGGLIDSVGAAKQMHGCTHIVNEPLVISIKRGGRHLMEDLEFGLSSIVEINTYVKVHRTFGLVSLSFFKNLERIKGEKLESGRFVLYVLENHDLETIWGPNQTVKMDEGRVFFHFNPKLCYAEIDKLRPSLKNSSQFDKSEVATDSNGSIGSCNTEVLNVTIVAVSSVMAHVRIKNPMRYEDDRVFIGYQYFYMEDPYGNASVYSSHRICDDGWSSSDPVKDVDHLFQNLKPYTLYAFYVKTQTISSEPRNGQSPIQHFKTKPDQPKLVQNLRASAKSPSEIYIQWLPPTVANGKLEKYIIRASIESNDPEQLTTRNFCKDPLKDSANIDVPNSAVIASKNDIGRQTSAGDDCKCDGPRKSSKQPQVEEAIFENIIDFENNLQNFIYVKVSNTSHHHMTSHVKNGSFLMELTAGATTTSPMTTTMTTTTTIRRRRQMMNVNNNFSLFQLTNNFVEGGKSTSSSASASSSSSYDIPRESRLSENKLYFEYSYNEANASMNEFVITGLKHFSLYTIYVRACRAIEENATTNECSPDSITYARTKKRDDVDKVRNLQATLEKTNTTRNIIRLKWDPPETPNSITVSYTISYISDAQDAVSERKCITAGDYQNLTNGYVLSDLSTGNYTIRVRANSLGGEGLDSEPVYKFVPPTQISNEMIITIGICFIILVVLLCSIVYYLRKKILATPSDLKMFPTVNPYYISLHYVPDEWEVPRDKVIQLGALGQGSFGMVYEGILKSFNNIADDIPCAIKTVNENATDRERMNFLNEASVMKQFDTYHVVRLLGVCSQGQPALVVMELMKNGDLKSFLRQHRADSRDEHDELLNDELQLQPPPLSRILQMAIEIADGMAYLAAKKYVHRDLAARNCMVATDLTVKIGDFGMTRDVYETDYYRKGTKGLLPVRWMPPESLKDGVYSSASDVFSYGVVLWEMATLASQPYPGYSNDQVLRYVIDGGVMERPENCPDKLYKLMQKCWHHRPTARPTFMEIIRYLLDTADPHFREVSFYHSDEASALRNQIHAENLQNSCDLFTTETDHDLDDVTTPLRAGEYDFKLNIDNNSSVGHHGSPMAIDEDQPHSPYSLGSAILISSTPGDQSKNSFTFSSSMYKNNPTLSLPSSSGAVKYGITHNFPMAAQPHQQQQQQQHEYDDSKDLYVQPDPDVIFSNWNRAGSSGGGGGGGNNSSKDDPNNGYQIHDPITVLPQTERRNSTDNEFSAASVSGEVAEKMMMPSQSQGSSAGSNNYKAMGSNSGGGGVSSSHGLKRTVAEKVQNVGNSLVPLRLRNMDFLRNRRLFNHKRSGSVIAGSCDLNAKKSSSNSNLSSNSGGGGGGGGNVECNSGSGSGSGTSMARSFLANLTPSHHTSENPNYQILNESLSTSALAHGEHGEHGDTKDDNKKGESITIVKINKKGGDDDDDSSPNPESDYDVNEDDDDDDDDDYDDDHDDDDKKPITNTINTPTITIESIDERIPLSRRKSKSNGRNSNSSKQQQQQQRRHNRQLRNRYNDEGKNRVATTTNNSPSPSPSITTKTTEIENNPTIVEQCNLNKENRSCSYVREKTPVHTTTATTTTATTLPNSPFNSNSIRTTATTTTTMAPAAFANRNRIDDVPMKSLQQQSATTTTTAAATTTLPSLPSPKSRSAYQLKETWLKQQQQPPNGFIGRDG